MNFLKAVLFEDEFEPIPTEEVEKRELTSSKPKQPKKKAAKKLEKQEAASSSSADGAGMEQTAPATSEITEESPAGGDTQGQAVEGQEGSTTAEAKGEEASQAPAKEEEQEGEGDAEEGEEGEEGEQEVGEEGEEEEGDEAEEDEEGEGVEEDEEHEDEELFPGLNSGWSFASGLVQAIASKSEEVLREYSAELQEFGRELKKETEDLVETTTHTVKDLPGSLETGAQVAQNSLEGIGHTVEEFGSTIWKGTTDIINQVKEAIAAVDEEALRNAQGGSRAVAGYTAAIQKGKYSRYEAQVSAMQRDSSTYCDEPEDAEEFAKWCESFKLEDKQGDIDAILKENAFMQELQSRIVPLIVEKETFWTRYFYRLHKLQQAEDARADLVKRATTVEEEDLSWDVDDDSEGTTPKVEAAEGSTAAPEGKVEEETKEAPSAGSGDEGRDSSNSSSSTSEWQVVSKEEEHTSLAPAVPVKPDVAAETEPEPAAEAKPEPAAEKPAAAPTEGKEAEKEGEKPVEAKVESTTAEPAKSKSNEGKDRKGPGEKGPKASGDAGDEEVDEDWGEWE